MEKIATGGPEAKEKKKTEKSEKRTEKEKGREEEKKIRKLGKGRRTNVDDNECG